MAEAERAVNSDERCMRGMQQSRLSAWTREHRWTAITVVALTATFAIRGRVPADPILAAVLIVLVMTVDGLTTRGIDGALRVARDWLPITGLLVVYDLTRGIADQLGMPLQVDALIQAEEFLFGGQVPTIWLQEQVLGEEAAWWESLLAITYTTHFLFSFILLGVLYFISRSRWLAYVRRFVTLNVAGMLTYVLVPAAPPWWASAHGHLDGAERTLARGWEPLGLQAIGNVLKRGQAGANDVAALPSLHEGYAVLFVVVIWAHARRARPLLALYPLAMGFTLVIGAEHYVVDLLLGGLYAALIHVGWTRWEDRRQTESAAAAPVPEALEASAS